MVIRRTFFEYANFLGELSQSVKIFWIIKHIEREAIVYAS